MRLTPTICACTAALLLCSCRTDLPDAATDGPDSLYTAAHIEKIALDQPEEALALLDEAEEKRLLSPFEISDLRRRVEANPYASTPDGEYLRIPCLLIAGRYDEALHYIRREKQLLQETTDTVSWDYIGSHLQMELEAWQGKGDWKQASRVQSGMMALTDTLRQRERQEDALELAEIYRSNEKDREIARQEESLRRLHIVLALMVPVLVLLILYIRNILKAGSIVRRKNEAMVKTIDELMARKDELFGLQEENLRLRGELQRLHAEEVTPAEEPGPPGDGEGTTAVRTLTDDDRALFERMHHEILRNRLYLRADFNKKELVKEFHIPANKFAPLFREFAGCSFTQYIQDCRLDYAVRLMREQPQWTLDAIAKEAGMSNGALYSQFQKKYGMKPSDYRRGM